MQTIEPSELLVINRDDYFHSVETVPQFGKEYINFGSKIVVSSLRICQVF